MALPALAITALLGWASAATAAAGAADAAEAPPGQIWPEVRAPAGRLRGAKRGQAPKNGRGGGVLTVGCLGVFGMFLESLLGACLWDVYVLALILGDVFGMTLRMCLKGCCLCRCLWGGGAQGGLRSGEFGGGWLRGGGVVLGVLGVGLGAA